MRPEELGIGRLFDRTRDAVIVADAETQRIVLWNPAAANMFGYSASEAFEMRVEDLVPEHLKDQHRAGISHYAKTGHGPFFGEERLASLLRSSLGLEAQAIADRVENSVSEFQKDDPHDDVAILVLRVPESCVRRRWRRSDEWSP